MDWRQTVLHAVFDVAKSSLIESTRVKTILTLFSYVLE